MVYIMKDLPEKGEKCYSGKAVWTNLDGYTQTVEISLVAANSDDALELLRDILMEEHPKQADNIKNTAKYEVSKISFFRRK